MKVSSIVNLKLREQYWSISISGILTDHSTGRSWSLEKNVRNLDVKEYIPPSAGESKLTRSAAGAILGFLVAGPIGTLAGAGIGAGGAKEPEAGSYDVSFAVWNPVEVVRAKVSADELRKLQSYLVEEPAPRPERAAAAQLAPLPKPAIKASASSKLIAKVKPAMLAGAAKTTRQKKIVKPEQTKLSSEMERKLAKLAFLRREQVITDEEYEFRCSLVRREIN